MSERFTLHALVGTGTCSSVYRARDELLDREVAVKVFPVTDDPRVAREVSLLASLDHPALVPVYDLGEVDGRAFVVMAMFEGGNLADRLAESGPLPLGEALLTAAAVADALAHVHRAGVLHRDVTPRNVLFDTDGRAHLSDFGVALVADAPRITDTGIVVGSAPYLAPEQVRGETVGPTADVYSLGLVTIEALTGRRAYEGAPLEAAQARLEHPPVLPEGLPDEVHALLDTMTADDPDTRPDAETVCRRLRRAALADEIGPDDPRDDLPATALVPAPAVASPGRRVGRGTMVLGAATLSILLASGVVIAATGPVRSVAATTPPGAGQAAPTIAAPFVPPGEQGADASSDTDSSADSSDADSSGSSDSSDSSGSPAASPVADSERDTGDASERSERTQRAPVSLAEPPSRAPERAPSTTSPSTTTGSTTPQTTTPSTSTSTPPTSTEADQDDAGEADRTDGRGGGDRSGGDRSGGDRSGGDRSDGDRSDGDRSDGDDSSRGGGDDSERSGGSERDGLLDGAVEALDRPLNGLLGG